MKKETYKVNVVCKNCGWKGTQELASFHSCNMTNTRKKIKAWAIATKKGNGFYYPASFQIKQPKSIYEWFAVGIMWGELEAKEYCAFLKRHGLHKSFKVVHCEITILN